MLPLAAGALTATAYLLWLGWHQLENKSAYEPWQVVGLALTLGLLVIAPTWRSALLGLVCAAVVTESLTVTWSWDAATTPTTTVDANFWPIGAVFLFSGAFAGLTATCGITALIKALMSPPRRA